MVWPRPSAFGLDLNYLALFNLSVFDHPAVAAMCLSVKLVTELYSGSSADRTRLLRWAVLNWQCTQLTMYSTDSVLNSQCTQLTVYLTDSVLNWQCTQLTMYSIHNVLNWQCTQLTVYCVRFVWGGGGIHLWELPRQSESPATESQLDDPSLLASHHNCRHGRLAHYVEGKEKERKGSVFI